MYLKDVDDHGTPQIPFPYYLFHGNADINRFCIRKDSAFTVGTASATVG